MQLEHKHYFARIPTIFLLVLLGTVPCGPSTGMRKRKSGMPFRRAGPQAPFSAPRRPAPQRQLTITVSTIPPTA